MGGWTWTTLGVLAVSMSGCGLLGAFGRGPVPTPTPLASPDVLRAAEPEQATGCKIASDPFNPFIVEWPGTQRANLEAQAQRGLVAVSYVGCTLKVLESCDLAGNYEDLHTTPNHDHFDMASEDDLYAKLPLGAATLKGELKANGAMRFDYVAASVSKAKGPPTAMRGNCDGVTHYIRSMTKGAFTLGSLASSVADGHAGTGGIGIGGHSSRTDNRGRDAGDVKRCLDGDAPSCGAILQLSLAEVSLGTQEAGFGAGLGRLTDIPIVPSANSVLPQMDFSRANPDYLELVDAAKAGDKDANRRPLDRAALWDKVSGYAGDNAYKADAEARAASWRELDRRQKERAAQVNAAWQQYKTDQSKLNRLLALSEDTVPAKQKDAYRREFTRVYAPWEREFAARREADEARAAPRRAADEARAAPRRGADEARAAAEAAKSRAGSFVSLPAGCFTMGGAEGEADEKPPHNVCLGGFELGKNEVTVEQYSACVSAGACSEPGTGGDCNWGVSGRRDHPINCVFWDQAQAYARWAHARLPTEAEWEYAARSGGRDQQYPWGDESPSCDRAIMDYWGNGCGRGATGPVCSKPGGNSAQGACDLAGNVWEWTQDSYHDSYTGAPGDGSAYMSPAGSYRVYRGGSWNGPAGFLRARGRGRAPPGYAFVFLGFRLAR